MKLAGSQAITVLVLDDDPGILRLQCRALERAGYSVQATASAQEAIDQVHHCRPDLLLLDYRLDAAITGLDVYRELREEGIDLPAILVTAFSDENRILEALRAGVRDVVPKGGQYLEYLPQAIARVLGQIRAERDALEAEALRKSEQQLRELAEAMTAARVSAEQAKAIAEEASRAKDQFLAALSHELRTPLTPVVTALSMLLQQWHGDDAMRDTLEMIRRNVQMEATLIDDLLDVTRIVRGKIQLARRPIPLREVIRRAMEVCGMDLQTKHLDLDVDTAGIAEYYVDADPERLQQVFWNLLKNAIKFTPQGGRIKVRCREENDQLITEVIDNGEGIEPGLLPHIFNPFEQGGSRITRQFGGLGLGLTITRGVVELHGGTIEAHSEGKGKGATFRVRLPIHTPQEGLCPHPAIRSPAPENPAARKPRVLLVEDHGDTAKVIRRLLMMHGYDVETAANVASALELVESGRFDLLLSDLGLPDGSGLDLMQRLRERGRALPGIAFSGFGQEEDIRRSKDAGFTAHLIKPANPDQIIETLGRIAHSGDIC